MKIHVDQLGYRPDSEKCAVLTAESEPKGWAYLKSEDGTTSVELSISAFGSDSYSGDSVWTVDFSDIKTEGRYFIEYYDCSRPGGEAESPVRSDVFSISRTVYQDVFKDLIHMFYFMRCGCELPEKYAGAYHHKSCHDGPTLRYDDGAMLPPMTGGWHDAGDYGRYTTPGAVAAAHLLYAYELYSQKCPDLLIPESGNGVPDILNECRYELEWLLKMQKADGSAYHKLTTEKFSPFIMPEEDREQMVLYPISSMATADLGAIAALGARIYQRYDMAFATKMKKAAIAARNFLADHPDLIGFRNPPGNATGGYWDWDDRDERMWMYAELYRLTGDSKDLEMLQLLSGDNNPPKYPPELLASPFFKKLNLPQSVDKTALGWGQVGGLAGMSIVFAPADTFPDELVSVFFDAFREKADSLLALTKQNGYRLAMSRDGFVWGSNMNVMNCAATLLTASFLTGNTEYVTAAEENVHYLLGRNPLDTSYVTGHGAHAFRNPHNRPTASDGVDEPYPGLVSGGPNAHPMDEPARAVIPEGAPPMRCFLDDVGSFSTNEIAIYWNSIAVLVFAYFA